MNRDESGPDMAPVNPGATPTPGFALDKPSEVSGVGVPPSGFFQRKPLRRALKNWLERHRHPFNFWIHMLGIPLAVAGVVLFFTLSWEQWHWGLAGFILGYVLQYLGHLVEGNDLGEWAALKRLLGLPYVGISPRWQQSPSDKFTAPQ